MSDDLRVTMRDIRECGMCGAGTLAFFHRHNPELRSEMVKQGGVSLNALEATGDAMALQVCEYVRCKNGRE